jgi:hypothetical protein
MPVKYFDWDDAKNATLRAKRGNLLDILEHANANSYGDQRLFFARREDDVYLVPFVDDEHTVFLKTDHPQPESYEAVPR